MGSLEAEGPDALASPSGSVLSEGGNGSGGYIFRELFHVDRGGKEPTFAIFFHKPTGYPD